MNLDALPTCQLFSDVDKYVRPQQSGANLNVRWPVVRSFGAEIIMLVERVSAHRDDQDDALRRNAVFAEHCQRLSLKELQTELAGPFDVHHVQRVQLPVHFVGDRGHSR